MPAESKARRSGRRGQQAKAAISRTASSAGTNTILQRLLLTPLAGPAGIVFDP